MFHSVHYDSFAAVWTNKCPLFIRL